VSQLAAQKRARLQTIVAERAAWASQLTQVKRVYEKGVGKERKREYPQV